MSRPAGRPAVDYRRLAAADLSDLSLGAGERRTGEPPALPPPPPTLNPCLPPLPSPHHTPSPTPPSPPADALGTDFRALHSELLSYGGYRTAGVRTLPSSQLTPAWLQQHGGFRPVLVPGAPAAARELGIALPEGSLTVDRLAARIGLPWEVHTLDVQSQGEGPRWTLHQWCAAAAAGPASSWLVMMRPYACVCGAGST